MDVLEGDAELTEFEALDVRQVKGVGKGASGFPMLLMKGLSEPEAEPEPEGEPGDAAEPAAEPAAKSGPPAWHPAAVAMVRMATAAPGIPRESLFKAVAADGSVDEQPDIDGGKQAIALIAKLIGYEAQELEAGCMSEIWDIQYLCDAASALRCWLSGEVATQAAGTPDAAGVVMASAAEPWDYPADDVAKDSRSFSADDRKKQAGKGNALPDGSYPIPDADALRRAAVLARSGHGDAAAAKKLIARRAKELGVANPLEGKDDTSKAAVAAGEAVVDTEPQGTGDLSKAVEDAVTKATAPLKAEIESLQAFKAKVEALPVPGGPVMSITRPAGQGAGGEDHAAKAAYYEQMAATVASPADADNYRQLAAQARAKVSAPAA